VVGSAVGEGVAVATLGGDGRITTTPVVPIDTSRGKPTELCWLSVSPDDQWVYATNFGYSDISTYRLEGNVLTVAKDPACPKGPGGGALPALKGNVGSGPSDNALPPDGPLLHQIYGKASKLVGYAVHPDGSLEEITSAWIPYNSPQGLAGS